VCVLVASPSRAAGHIHRQPARYTEWKKFWYSMETLANHTNLSLI